MLSRCVEMASWRLDAEMSGGAFCNTRNRSSEFLRCSRLRLKAWLHRRRQRAEPVSLVLSTRMYCAIPVPIIENAGSNIQNHQPCPIVRESTMAMIRNAMPMKMFLNDWSRVGSRDPASSTASAFINFFNRWLHHLPRQSLRNETDICSASATKTRTVEILGGAFRTEHLYFSPLTSSVRWRLAS